MKRLVNRKGPLVKPVLVNPPRTWFHYHLRMDKLGAGGQKQHRYPFADNEENHTFNDQDDAYFQPLIKFQQDCTFLLDAHTDRYFTFLNVSLQQDVILFNQDHPKMNDEARPPFGACQARPMGRGESGCPTSTF